MRWIFPIFSFQGVSLWRAQARYSLVPATAAIVSLTHDPRIDELAMMEAINTHAFYIGIMDSAKNSEKRKHRLQSMGGLQPEDLARIKAPVGLAIGSKTPAEIALSVMADIVKTRNGV